MTSERVGREVLDPSWILKFDIILLNISYNLEGVKWNFTIFGPPHEKISLATLERSTIAPPSDAHGKSAMLSSDVSECSRFTCLKNVLGKLVSVAYSHWHAALKHNREKLLLMSLPVCLLTDVFGSVFVTFKSPTEVTLNLYQVPALRSVTSAVISFDSKLRSCWLSRSSITAW